MVRAASRAQSAYVQLTVPLSSNKSRPSGFISLLNLIWCEQPSGTQRLTELALLVDSRGLISHLILCYFSDIVYNERKRDRWNASNTGSRARQPCAHCSRSRLYAFRRMPPHRNPILIVPSQIFIFSSNLALLLHFD